MAKCCEIMLRCVDCKVYFQAEDMERFIDEYGIRVLCPGCGKMLFGVSLKELKGVEILPDVESLPKLKD